MGSTDRHYSSFAPERFTAPPEIEIIVPAYNEEQRIGPTLLALVDQLQSMSLRGIVSVVDNGSSDRTAEAVDTVIEAVGARWVTLTGCARKGKGNAVARGILASGARWVGFTDADLATPAAALEDAVGYLRGGWPVVIGSRRVEGAELRVEQPAVRRVGTKAFQLVTRRFAGDVLDTQCGFKFFQRAAAQRIFADTSIGGFAFDLEVLARARTFGFEVKEFPVQWSDRPGSTLRPFRDGLDAALDIWELHRSMRDTVSADA
jgi:glycosyltransferase involved in cell wall biosynthesis